MKFLRIPKYYENGATRKRRVFALFPTRVKEYTVWLETYEITEEYFHSCGVICCDGTCSNAPENGKWLLKEKRRCSAPFSNVMR